jgi:hypothetical protein
VGKGDGRLIVKDSREIAGLVSPYINVRMHTYYVENTQLPLLLFISIDLGLYVTNVSQITVLLVRILIALQRTELQIKREGVKSGYCPVGGSCEHSNYNFVS